MSKVSHRMFSAVKPALLLAVVAFCCSGCPLQQGNTSRVVFLNASPWQVESITQNEIYWSADDSSYVTRLHFNDNYVSELFDPKAVIAAKNLPIEKPYSFCVSITSAELGVDSTHVDGYLIILDLWLDKDDAYVVIGPPDEETFPMPFSATVFGENLPIPVSKQLEAPNRMRITPLGLPVKTAS